MAIIAPGTYRINPFLFSVQLADAVDIPDNKVGVVTTREGFSLPAGEIAGRKRQRPGRSAAPRPRSSS
jgi:hypothetical protein